ncbi:LysR family transcriptional regulator [Gluconacetobacter liquefaciens]|uniref:DNA-binding transcriptional LysR family regulator n=1 Tax=Gluconacetobacter liquefaciens TaxID=89584 RepID=A0A370G2X8_GLULI|nr:LysR family transcriptional regulator [Gluconacetobacter liquefaciens]MBB2187445.1 LysR family transcriptional regulator [Gluconacetobacter liquefaciens]RDI36413.1 DNA-binding transcriptional LysR family regulator [Gluconacetobacter liquefaciens]GBQ92892.1 LysR family transcriptional regulator [Gluconacetobacter liquefaciens NRIC 0522]GEB37970.1 LysR family transcriptional regulator [Gluconacetobacter liquefaciens]
MRREELVDLNAFMAVAEEQSFTRAAAKLGTSQSTLSHTIRRLEARLNVQLLTRTTRRVSPTQAGERLLSTLVPALETIADEIASLSELSEKPSGTVRITTSEHAASTLLWPALRRLLPDYPDLRVELALDAGLTDIVAERFDAGVRLEETIARDMIAVPIGPKLRLAVVGAPSYFARHPIPRTPQDLARHSCINLRFPTAGGVYAWDLEKGRRALRVRVDGQLTFNNVPMIRQAALDGFGLACVMEDQIMPYLAEGRLVRVLEDWCPPFPGYHLYYPSRRQSSAAFRLVVDALRYRG